MYNKFQSWVSGSNKGLNDRFLKPIFENHKHMIVYQNLLFHGINETQNENCEILVKQFITEKLNITQDVTIDRAHRLGKPRNRIRPIVVKFHYYTERELVRNKAFEKSAELKAINQGVSVQQTKSVLQKRRDLSAVFDREKAAGRSVKWAGARLMVRDGNAGEFREIKE